MSKKCFMCNKRNWKPLLIPFCSKSCETKFNESEARKERVKECEKQLKELKSSERVSIQDNSLESFEKELKRSLKLSEEVA